MLQNKKGITESVMPVKSITTLFMQMPSAFHKPAAHLLLLSLG